MGNLNDNDSHMLANSINHYELIQHQQKLDFIIGEQELQLVKTFGIIPYKDGNKWCYLLGDNLQIGICGFGDTPYKAMIDFNNNYNRN